MTRSVFDDIVGQSKAVKFLRAAVDGDVVSHAYLFVGPPGSGKRGAALALACAIVCEDGGCGTCAACTRVRRRTHPDVHCIEPEGTAGYIREQMDAVIHDVSLAPIEARKKVYLIESADLFNDASANAFLKTLEEPPDDVAMILMAHSYDAVLPTIVSRCQVVRFARIPPSRAAELLMGLTGADHAEATAALAASGGVVPRAREMLASPARKAARQVILAALKDLSFADSYDVLLSARRLLEAVKAPLEQVKSDQAAESAKQAEFLGKSGTKALEERHKRELTAREREGVAEVLNVAESWLRDCLVMSQGLPDLVVNADAVDAMEEVAAVITPAAVSRGMDAVNRARRRISYNVSPQLAIEAMLFDIREVLKCPR